jgi:hypothetical protein
MGNWTQRHVRALVAHAQEDDPRWEWKLRVRPETAALLLPEAGLLWHPDPKYAPLEVQKFADCEVAVIDLLADIVMASPVDEYGFTPDVADAATYWLNMTTGRIAVWGEGSLAELGLNPRGG